MSECTNHETCVSLKEHMKVINEMTDKALVLARENFLLHVKYILSFIGSAILAYFSGHLH